MYLYGCQVGKGKEGQAFIEKLSKELKCPVHAWTGKVYAFSKDPAIPVGLQSNFFVEGDKKDVNVIPAVSEWGLVVMAVLVVAAATIVIRRGRAVARHSRS